MKNIPGFKNYRINDNGTVYNNRGQVINSTSYKYKRYVRLYRNGERYTVSVDRIIEDLYGYNDIKLLPGERIFRYYETNYYITNKCRVWNSKFKRFLNVVYRNGSPTVNLSLNGRVEVVSIIKFLKALGGQYE